MPQTDIYYSDALPLKLSNLFNEIEKLIQGQDKSAGNCKCRAHPLENTHHTHVLVVIKLLKRPHRDKNFMNILLKSISQIVIKNIPKGCHYSVEVDFLSAYYATGIK